MMVCTRVPAECPKEVANLMNACLETSPALRPTAMEALQRLQSSVREQAARKGSVCQSAQSVPHRDAAAGRAAAGVRALGLLRPISEHWQAAGAGGGAEPLPIQVALSKLASSLLVAEAEVLTMAEQSLFRSKSM